MTLNSNPVQVAHLSDVPPLDPFGTAADHRRLDEETRQIEMLEAKAIVRRRDHDLAIRRQRLIDDDAMMAAAVPRGVTVTEPVTVTALPAAAMYTPVRVPLPSTAARRLPMSAMTAVGQAAFAATLARQQSIDELPDAVAVPAATLRRGVVLPVSADRAAVEAAKVKTPIPKEFTLRRRYAKQRGESVDCAAEQLSS